MGDLGPLTDVLAGKFKKDISFALHRSTIAPARMITVHSD
jgi:hypothetical protein